jgi:hypothetical protein
VAGQSLHEDPHLLVVDYGLEAASVVELEPDALPIPMFRSKVEMGDSVPQAPYNLPERVVGVTTKVPDCLR